MKWVVLLVALVPSLYCAYALGHAWYERRKEEQENEARVRQVWPKDYDPLRLQRLRAIAERQREDKERWP